MVMGWKSQWGPSSMEVTRWPGLPAQRFGPKHPDARQRTGLGKHFTLSRRKSRKNTVAG